MTTSNAPATPAAPAAPVASAAAPSAAPAAPVASAAAPSAAPAAAAPAASPIDVDTIGKMIEAKLAEALGKMAPAGKSEPQPDPLKDAPPWARELTTKIAGIEQQQHAQAEAGRRAALERAALAGVPEANAAKARTMLAGLLVERGVSKIPDDTTALAGDLGKALQALAPDLYRVPGSSFAALPRAAAGGGIDWARINSIAELPTDEIRNIPEEHLDRIIHGAGGDPTGRPSTMPRTIRLVPGGK